MGNMKTQEKYGDMSGSKLSSREMSAYFRKNPKAKAVRKAVEIALDHGGAMSYAMKQIEKLKRGLSKHPEVKKALNTANYESVATDKFKAIVTENYTKNFQNLCIALKFNSIQQKILEDFISTGLVEQQYVGRIAGRAKESKTYAAAIKYNKNTHENIKEALMKALKVNAPQKNILSKYLSTGRVVGKYTGSVAGTTKTTKDYIGYQGFAEQAYPTISEELIMEAKPKADGKEFKWNRETHPALSDDTVEIDVDFVNWDKKGNNAGPGMRSMGTVTFSAKGVAKRFKLKFRHSRGDTWLISGKAADVFYYITTEYDGNAANGKSKPNSMDHDFLYSNWPELYDSYAKEDVNEALRDIVKIKLKFRKEIAYLKKNNNAKGSKKEQQLLDAITSILMNKEKGDWKDPDFADIQALELIWADEWNRLK